MWRQTNIEYQQRLIGWMAGFQWTQHSYLKYTDYASCFYAKVQEQVIGIIHKKLKQSQKFREHLYLPFVNFVAKLCFVIGIAVISIGFFVDLTSETEELLYIVGGSLTFASSVINILEYCFDILTFLFLRSRLLKLIQQLNVELAHHGLFVRFPEGNFICCFCLTCCACLGQNFERIQIYEKEEEDELSQTLLCQKNSS